ncbi:unnamed protein product, partial [Nesidiocoris tenuis]
MSIERTTFPGLVQKEVWLEELTSLWLGVRAVPEGRTRCSFGVHLHPYLRVASTRISPPLSTRAATSSKTIVSKMTGQPVHLLGCARSAEIPEGKNGTYLSHKVMV